MQQTNVIHVAQGGTVILPGQSQNTQVNHHGNQQVNQARSDIKISKHVENDRLILPHNILNFGSSSFPKIKATLKEDFTRSSKIQIIGINLVFTTNNSLRKPLDHKWAGTKCAVSLTISL